MTRGYEDDWDFGYERVAVTVPNVSDHVATDTGLLDSKGNPIMRPPNPIGFVWDERELRRK